MSQRPTEISAVRNSTSLIETKTSVLVSVGTLRVFMTQTPPGRVKNEG